MLVEPSLSGGQVVSRNHLLHRVWGPQKSSGLPTLRTHLVRLRHKLGEDAENPKCTFAEPRVGYRMPRGEPAGHARDQRVSATKTSKDEGAIGGFGRLVGVL